MSAIEVDLRLRSPHWSRVTTSVDTVNDGNGLWVRADHDCSDPTDPEVLVSHPGRLTAIQIDGMRSSWLRTVCAHGPCSGPLRTG